MRIVIVGNGVAGVTAALTAREEDPSAHITIISDESPLFYSRPALMYVHMRDLKPEEIIVHPEAFYKKRKIQLVQARITSIDTKNQKITDGRETWVYDRLLLAIGARARRPWPNSDAPNVFTFTNLNDLQGIETATEYPEKNGRVVVIGGGLIGIEVAEMMRRRKIDVTLLVREDWYWPVALSRQEGDLIATEARAHGVDLRLSTGVKSLDLREGKVRSVTIANGEMINCDFVVITAGVDPALSPFIPKSIKTDRGILVDKNLATSADNVYAAGDCAEINTGKETRVELTWYTARMQGKVAGRNLTGASVAYDPGIWFNSAKFFTIDYHNYGRFPASQGEEFLYQDPARRKSLRIAYDNKGVIAFNILGSRFRHNVCENWVRNRTPLEEVLANLDKADFEPEFSRSLALEVKKWSHQPIAQA